MRRHPLRARAPVTSLVRAAPALARVGLAAFVRALAPALALVAATAGAGCGDPGKPSGGTSSGPSAASSSSAALATGRAQAAAPATSAVVPEGVDLLKFVLTSGVAHKDPVDTLDAAKPGQRVYGHATVRNRTSGKKRVSLSFRVNGQERSMVDLDVEKSWSWRTWAYVTLRKDDKGELTVHVFDDHGAELGTQTIPIR